MAFQICAKSCSWLSLFLTPVANVAVERSFSCMHRVRTFVRSSMKEDRLSTLSNLNIENDLAQKIDFDKLIDIFARMPIRFATAQMFWGQTMPLD
jgi:hypothetical protein